MNDRPRHQYVSVNGTAMQLMYEDPSSYREDESRKGYWYYHRVNGRWSIRNFYEKDGTLYVKSFPGLIGKPMIPITREEYIRDEGLKADKLFN